MKRITQLVLMLAICGLLSAQTRYELLLKGGRVIDPKNGINETMDVAIADGKIARRGREHFACRGRKDR